jgi:hypothetical protein
MNGNWLRVSPAELDEARADLDAAYDLAEEARNGEHPGRWAGSGQAWNGLDFLLHRLGFDVPLIFGAESLVELPDVEPDSPEMAEFLESADDWGYGPPAALTPAQVATAATRLAGLTEADLVRDVDPAELDRAECYPGGWTEPGRLEWVAHHLPNAQRFFAAAAKDGDAVICWLD